MSEGNSRSRSILGDLTNRVDKRGFSDKGFGTFSDKERVKRRRPCTEISSLKGNLVSSISKIPNQTRGSHVFNELISASSEDDFVPRGAQSYKKATSIDLEADGCVRLDLLKEDLTLGIPNGGNVVDLTTNDSELLGLTSEKALPSFNLETNKELGGSFFVDRTVNETGDCRVHDGKSCDAGEAKFGVQGSQSDFSDFQNDADQHNEDVFVLSQSGSVDCTILPESQESRVFGMERSTHLKKGDECIDINGDLDSIKACSCSFCTKAASIWLDLNYQDIRARVSAIKKSQKEAIILAERSCRSKATGAENLTRVSNVESTLKYQWRSLFQNMADIWEKEANQLEASLQPLYNLRGKCKTDLGSINATPSEKH